MYTKLNITRIIITITFSCDLIIWVNEAKHLIERDILVETCSYDIGIVQDVIYTLFHIIIRNDKNRTILPSSFGGSSHDMVEWFQDLFFTMTWNPRVIDSFIKLTIYLFKYLCIYFHIWEPFVTHVLEKSSLKVNVWFILLCGFTTHTIYIRKINISIQICLSTCICI